MGCVRRRCVMTKKTSSTVAMAAGTVTRLSVKLLSPASMSAKTSSPSAREKVAKPT